MNLKIILLTTASFISGSLFAQEQMNCCQDHKHEVNTIDNWNAEWKKWPKYTIHPDFIYADRSAIEVIIKVNVDETGKVIDTKIIKSTGDPIQDKRFEDAIRRASFYPFIENGEAKAFSTEQRIKIEAPL